jgi:hypothetical protein
MTVGDAVTHGTYVENDYVKKDDFLGDEGLKNWTKNEDDAHMFCVRSG